MSFGISIGDFIALGKLAFGIYQRCHDGPQELRALCIDIANLRNVVELFGITLKDRDLTPGQEASALKVRDDCQEMLAEIGEMLAKYEKLPKNKKWQWRWIGWGKDRVPSIRQRLILNSGMLTSFNTTLAATGIARIEKGLDQLRIEFQAGRRQGSVISSSRLHEAKEGNESVWREISQALEDVGISESMVSEHRDYIVNWLSKALKEGELEERPPQENPGESPEMANQGVDDQEADEIHQRHRRRISGSRSGSFDSIDEIHIDPASFRNDIIAASQIEEVIMNTRLPARAPRRFWEVILFLDVKNTVRSVLEEADLWCLREGCYSLRDKISVLRALAEYC